jgi:hypothetical protein
MNNLERRLRRLETRAIPDSAIVIEVEYVYEPPKSDIAGRDDRLRPDRFSPGITTVYLSEDDLRL